MTTATQHPVHADEVVALRQELAETRREMAHLIAATARQDRGLRDLQRALQGAAQRSLEGTPAHPQEIILTIGQRMERAERAICDLRDEVKRDAYAFSCFSVWAEGLVNELNIWVHHLLQRISPHAHAFCYTELARIFPNGCGYPPPSRLPDRSRAAADPASRLC